MRDLRGPLVSLLLIAAGLWWIAHYGFLSKCGGIGIGPMLIGIGLFAPSAAHRTGDEIWGGLLLVTAVLFVIAAACPWLLDFLMPRC